MNPGQRSMDLLRKEGWMVDRVEQWVMNPKLPMGGFRRDVFHFGDLLGVHPEQGIALFQVTSRGCLSEHWQKLTAEPFELGEEPLSASVIRWLKWGKFYFHGWECAKTAKALAEAKAQGRQKWRIKRQQIVLKDGVLLRVERPTNEER